MSQIDTILSSTYDIRLVALSIAIALFTAYTTLDLAGRATAAKGGVKQTWLTGGAIAVGIGIWAMHFVGMLALGLPTQISYDPPIVMVSVLVAIVAAYGILYLASQQSLNIPQLALGGVLTGIGIAGVHYIGVAAMRLDARVQYNLSLVALSVALAIGASIAAVWIAFHLRKANKTGEWYKIGGAAIFGLAIAAMHYTGMAAANFTANTTTSTSPTSFTWLAFGVTLSTLVVLSFALLTAFVDRRLASQANLIELQEAETKKLQLSSQITQRIRESLNFNEIIKTTVKEVRKLLKTDRVVVYRFNPDWSGTVIAESVAPGWTQALEERIYDPCFKEHHIEQYQNGRVVFTSDIYNAGLTECHIKTLEQFEVKANLVAPIRKENQLLGLLIAHHCSEPHAWQASEVDIFTQLAIQVGFALDQAQLLEQVEKARSTAEIETERARVLADTTLRIRRSLKFDDILSTSVDGMRKALQTDRVLIYRFNPDWVSGVITAESVGPRWIKALGQTIQDPLKEGDIERYKSGRVWTTENIYEAELSACHCEILERLEVKANMVAPVMCGDNLLGLVCAHQCSGPRSWQQSEIDLFRQLAAQIGFALDQANLIEEVEKARREAEALSQEQQQQKEALQMQLIDLLSDVEGAANGDLTVRADVTAGEIGTVADFFNAIIESLRQTVIKVKNTAVQVSSSLEKNEDAVRELAQEALKQTEEITRTLDSVEQMTFSIQDVANSASQAAEVARTASKTAEVGGVAMDRTVVSILSLRETIAETAKKVKRLGESSQQISKIVSLINQIALQTNLLAINAGIEAARAGEQGRGFAVVAEEVGELAARSAGATKEIEQIVENIQLETSEVVRAMELGTTQVVEGTHLVEDAKQSLEQILQVSRQIDQLVQSISTATVSQAETSQVVTNLMKDIALVSERTSNSSRYVSDSLQQTVEVAQELQTSVGLFKVGY